MIKTNIIGGKLNKEAEVVKDIGSNKGALLVAVNKATKYENKTKYFTNPTYGINMNQNITLGGVTIGVHDGTDHTWWTATAESGDWDFAAEAQAQNGTYSISGVSTGNTSEASFAHATSQDLTGHTSIQGYIYITTWQSDAKHVKIYGWETTTPAIVGNLVNIDDYINTGELNTWQLFTIPLDDMGLENKIINQIRVQTVGLGTQPDYYLDLVNIIETGTPAEFKVEADKGTWLHVHNFNLVLADDYPGVVSDGTMPDIPFDSFLGVSGLSSGLVYQRSSVGEIIASYSIKNTLDFVEFPGSNIISYGSDGSNSWFKMELNLTEPIILKSEEEDYISFTLSEDLSGTSRFRIIAGCREEERE